MALLPETENRLFIALTERHYADDLISAIETPITWGAISGDMTTQPDLQAALDTKAPGITDPISGQVTIESSGLGGVVVGLLAANRKSH
jgi:hypothetical protein